jgi:transposase
VAAKLDFLLRRSSKNKSASVSTPAPRRKTQSVRCGARTCSGSWPRSSICSARWPASITCFTDWDTPICAPGLGIAKPRSEKQAAFLNAWPGRLRTIAAAQPTKRLRIYFQDESRFGQQGTTTNVWAAKGSRPTAIRQTEYQYLWVLGAVCPETGHAEGLLSPQLNTTIVNEFLTQFARTIPADEHAVMLWDGAGFHASRQLRVPDNVTVVTLPAYSPELNPIENLWHYLKSHYWSNQAYDDYDALEQAAVDAWCKGALDADLMKTVCAAPYLERATSN